MNCGSALQKSWCAFDLEGKRRQVAVLEKQAMDPGFWSSPSRAQHTMRRISALTQEIEEWHSLDDEAASVEELLELAMEEDDDSLLEGLRQDLAGVSERLGALEFRLALSGEYDERNAIIALHAGAGGVDSQDWTRMLMRMYLRWAERRGFSSDVLDVSYGEDGGVKSATVQLSGSYAFGYMRAERGVHRLVRISPFDGNHARHTSFALVEALPEAEEGVDVTIDPDDVRLDVFKAGGAGGQSVQKNSTAVRVTHVPTGIRVSCQNERSQRQNREFAMRILLARLVELEMRRRAEEMARLKGEHVSPEWGNQIRSYVLHPYQMVKDHRTGHENSSAEDILDGNIDSFIESFLASQVGG